MRGGGERWSGLGVRLSLEPEAVHLEGAVEVADVEAVAVELALEGGVAALRLAIDDLEHVIQREVRLRREEEERGEEEAWAARRPLPVVEPPPRTVPISSTSE